MVQTSLRPRPVQKRCETPSIAPPHVSRDAARGRVRYRCNARKLQCRRKFRLLFVLACGSYSALEHGQEFYDFEAAISRHARRPLRTIIRSFVRLGRVRDSGQSDRVCQSVRTTTEQKSRVTGGGPSPPPQRQEGPHGAIRTTPKQIIIAAHRCRCAIARRQRRVRNCVTHDAVRASGCLTS